MVYIVLDRYSKLRLQKPADMIKKIHDIDYKRRRTYVYDFTTQNHHFSAGVGRMVVHNTDSVMFTIPDADGTVTDVNDPESMKRRMQYVFDKGAEICRYITDQLPPALVFELEGVLYPSIYYKKKCYAARSFDNLIKQPKLKMKGLCSVRNDRSGLNKRISGTVLNMMIMDNNLQGAFEFVKAEVTKLKKNQLPLSDFVISKNLKTLEPKQKSPHVTAVLRLAACERPILGQKVEYCIINGKGDLSQNARVVSQTNLEDIDRKWYFEKAVKEPILELMAPVGDIATLKQDLLNIMNSQVSLATLFGSNKKITEKKKKRKTPVVEDDSQQKIQKFFK